MLDLSKPNYIDLLHSIAGKVGLVSRISAPIVPGYSRTPLLVAVRRSVLENHLRNVADEMSFFACVVPTPMVSWSNGEHPTSLSMRDSNPRRWAPHNSIWTSISEEVASTAPRFSEVLKVLDALKAVEAAEAPKALGASMACSSPRSWWKAARVCFYTSISNERFSSKYTSPSLLSTAVMSGDCFE